MSLLLCLRVGILLQPFMKPKVSMFCCTQLDTLLRPAELCLQSSHTTTCHLTLRWTNWVQSEMCTPRNIHFHASTTWQFVTFSVPGLLQQFCALCQSSSHFTTRLSYHRFTESQLGQMCELSYLTHTAANIALRYIQSHSRFNASRTSRQVELKIFIGVSKELLFCEKFLFTKPNGVTSQMT